MILYAALYNYMIYEAGYSTLSIHKTRQGARDSVAKELRKEHENHNKIYDYNVDEMGSPFGTFEAWDVQKIEVLE